MKKCIKNKNELKSDISRFLSGLPLSSAESDWFTKVYIREVLREHHYTALPVAADVADARQAVVYEPSENLRLDARYILDWLSELSQRDPRLHSKLARITFRQAHQHARQWHESLAKAAATSERYIPPDEVNAPKALDLGDGWEVFWLKSDLARDLEGAVMGHCIGSGAYDNLGKDQAVFSIRKNNVPHITMHVYDIDDYVAASKGNDPVPERYTWLAEEANRVVGIRVFLEKDPTKPLEDGEHTTAEGTVLYLKDGRLHRDDGPALLTHEGKESWYVNGKLHRDGAPAVAMVLGNSIQMQWWRDGRLHRDDGPAIYQDDGAYEEWYVDGKRHREDGPAVICASYTGWYLNGELHREDGPAYIRAEGQTWYRHGLMHREDGPADIWWDGTKVWCRDGVCHREDGPAQENPDGTVEWHLNGERYEGAQLLKAVEQGLFRLDEEDKRRLFEQLQESSDCVREGMDR